MQARARLVIEKQKIVVENESKTKKIGRDFRRAREHLEAGLKRQMVAIQERFGDVLIAGASLARRYGMQSPHAPQPIEVRIILLHQPHTTYLFAISSSDPTLTHSHITFLTLLPLFLPPLSSPLPLFYLTSSI